MASYGQSGPRLGTSVLSSEPSPKPFSDSRGRVRGDTYQTASGPAPGAPPVHGSPIGQPLAPEIGPNEPRGPADIARGDRKRSW
jgi:hypothetical protein